VGPMSSLISRHRPYFGREDHELIASCVPNSFAAAPNSDSPCNRHNFFEWASAAQLSRKRIVEWLCVREDSGEGFLGKDATLRYSDKLGALPQTASATAKWTINPMPH
jgi:hypothetical protein